MRLAARVVARAGRVGRSEQAHIAGHADKYDHPAVDRIRAVRPPLIGDEILIGIVEDPLPREVVVAVHIRRRRRRDLPFFFQAEDGIRDVAVTGVQTCALPISNLLPEYRETGSEKQNSPATSRPPGFPVFLTSVSRTTSSVASAPRRG